MSESKHTPGPWSYTKCRCGHPYCTQFEISTQRSAGFEEADARLIAAAPDMYEALQQCLQHIEVDETTHGRQFAAGNVARAALAKAEGRS